MIVSHGQTFCCAPLRFAHGQTLCSGLLAAKLYTPRQTQTYGTFRVGVCTLSQQQMATQVLDTNKPNEIHWSEPLEALVKSEAERCQALAWVHEESQRWCAAWNTRLMFPSIILATFTGAGAVGADQMLPFEGSGTLVGLLTLVVGTLQTIQNYYAFAKRSEAHRISALQYSKMHANLSTQLSLPRVERKPAADIIEMIQNETERLTEITPLIPQTIKEAFQKRFHDIEDFSIPHNLNGLVPVSVTSLDIIPRPKMRIELQGVPGRKAVNGPTQGSARAPAAALPLRELEV